MVIKRLGPLSCAKVQGALFVVVGLFIGLIFAAVFSLGLAMTPAGDGSGAGMFGMIFGVGAIIIFPICYGILGFLIGLIQAVLYNWVAGMVGGIEVDIS